MRISRAKLQQIIREEVGKLAERKPAEDKRGPEDEEPLEEEETLEEDEDTLEEGGLGDDLGDDESGAESYYYRTDRPQDGGGRTDLGRRGYGGGDSRMGRTRSWDDIRDRDPGPFEEGKKLTKEAVKRLVRQMIKEMNK